MKRILQFGGALLALGMLLASCNIGVGDGQVSSDPVRSTSNSTLNSTSNINGITLTIREIGNTGRTILPADWTAETASKLTYVLLVKKSGEAGGWETKTTFNYSQLTGGTAVVNLDLVAWDLKLIGYITDEDYETHPCLEKELTNVNLSTGIKTVTFDLKPVTNEEGVEKTQATGNVDVTIAWLTKQPKRLEFGIYDIGKTTEQIVEDPGRTKALFKETKTEDDFAPDGTAHKATWQPSNIKAGMYKFAAVFYNAEEDGNVIGYYIDWLYVDGGNDSIATVNYGDKFNTLPENPTWLAVETVFVPQEGPATITVNNWYYAKFHWNDNSSNETGFELVINDGTQNYVVSSKEDNGNLISDKWYNGPGIPDTTFNPTSNPNSLDAGSTWVVLKLKTETLYTAKIRAINNNTPVYTDTSAKFCENLNQNGDGQGRSYAPIVLDDTGAKKQFGMFSVNYALNGGTVTKAKASTTADTVKNYVVGFNYSSQQQDLMTDNILSYPFVSRIGYVFDYWNDATPKKFDVIPAKNKDKLELTAQWGGSDVKVTVTFPSYAEPAAVKIAADQNSDSTVSFKYSTTNNFISVNAGAITSPSFELSEVGNNGKIIAKDDDTTAGTSISGSKWTWKPEKAPTPGFYCLQITGTYIDARTGRTLTLCGNIYINVEN